MANCTPLSFVTHRLGALVLGAALTLGLGTACGDDLRGDDDGAGSTDDSSDGDGEDGSDGADDGEDDGEDDGSTACADTEVDEFPDVMYGSPDQVMADGFACPEGGLADADLTGRWSLFLGGSPFNYQYPYLSDSCEDGFEIDADIPGGAPLVHRDDTNVFIRSEQVGKEFSFSISARFCAGATPDELAVLTAQCITFTGEEQQCFVEPGIMRRFGRPEGEVEADGLELVAEWSGGDAPWPQSSASNVKVIDGIAFVSRLSYHDGDAASDLRLVDVSNPEKPADLGSFVSANPANQADFNDVKLFQVDGENYAILSGVQSLVIDASDPASPALASSIEYSHSVFVREDAEGRPLAYLANAEANVPIYDLSDPTAPTLLELVETPPVGMGNVGVHDLYAEEDRLYLNGQFAGFYVMDREGEEWTVGGNLPTGGYNHASWVGEIAGRQVAVMGDEGYGAHLQVVDVDPASKEFMTVIGEYQTRPDAGIHNIMLFGTRAYVVYYHDGVRIIDLADPTSPQLVAYYHTYDLETGGSGPFESAIGIDVDPEAGLIYVADMRRGLMILRETR